MIRAAKRRKPMNILILQGSPRANGNTAWMAEEYRKAAEAAGHEVTLVDVAHKKIAGCMACGYCRGKGNGACVQKDDMQELYPFLAEAEVLVLAAPIYYFTLSAQIQAPIQRIYCMNKPGKLKRWRSSRPPIRPMYTTAQSGSIAVSSTTGVSRTGGEESKLIDTGTPSEARQN